MPSALRQHRTSTYALVMNLSRPNYCRSKALSAYLKRHSLNTKSMTRHYPDAPFQEGASGADSCENLRSVPIKLSDHSSAPPFVSSAS